MRGPEKEEKEEEEEKAFLAFVAMRRERERDVWTNSLQQDAKLKRGSSRRESLSARSFALLKSLCLVNTFQLSPYNKVLLFTLGRTREPRLFRSPVANYNGISVVHCSGYVNPRDGHLLQCVELCFKFIVGKIGTGTVRYSIRSDHPLPHSHFARYLLDTYLLSID